MKTGRWGRLLLGALGLTVWSSVLFACGKRREPEPPPQPMRPACNGVMQTTCLPPLLTGQCLPQTQIGTACNGLTAMSEGQLSPAGCCYSVCVGIPGQCGPGM